MSRDEVEGGDGGSLSDFNLFRSNLFRIAILIAVIVALVKWGDWSARQASTPPSANRTELLTECTSVRNAVTGYTDGDENWAQFDDAMAVVKVQAEAIYGRYPGTPFIAQLIADTEVVQESLVATQSADPSPLLADCGLLSPVV